jgi:hypothetical protein
MAHVVSRVEVVKRIVALLLVATIAVVVAGGCGSGPCGNIGEPCCSGGACGPGDDGKMSECVDNVCEQFFCPDGGGC